MTTLLIVDDQPDIRRLINLTLGKRYDILEADNGHDALSLARAHRPQAMILDVMMPGGLDGFQVLTQIKQDPELKHIHVIMVTAKGQPSDLEFATQAGADGYLIKPFSPLQLIAMLQERFGQ